MQTNVRQKCNHFVTVASHGMRKTWSDKRENHAVHEMDVCVCVFFIYSCQISYPTRGFTFIFLLISDNVVILYWLPLMLLMLFLFSYVILVCAFVYGHPWAINCKFKSTLAIILYQLLSNIHWNRYASLTLHIPSTPVLFKNSYEFIPILSSYFYDCIANIVISI